MNHCTEYEMLINAYLDDELSMSDKMLVQEHLKICRDCAALFIAYREMSSLIKQSSSRAPQSLRNNVMKIIEGSGTQGDGSTVSSLQSTQKSRSRKARTQQNRPPVFSKRMILTRYAPIAACLAIAILVLPQLFNTSRPDSRYGDAVPTAALTMAEAEVAYDDVIGAFGFAEDSEELWGTPEVMTDEDFTAEVMPTLPPEAGERRDIFADDTDDMEIGPPIGGGLPDADGYLYLPHGIVTEGYYAFIIIDFNRPISTPMIAYYDNYFLIDQIYVARFIEEYGDFITLFMPIDEEALFALLLIES